MKIFLESLGCPKNTADSEYVLGCLKAAGCEVVSDLSSADVLIVNTCGFIQPAKEESIDTILQLAEDKGKRKLIVVGCLYERYKEELKKELPEVDEFVGVYELERIAEIVLGYECSFYQRYPITPKHIAYLKIGDGCSNSCTFCSIPLIKGKFWSKPIGQVVDEASRLVESGVKEINLVAQDTTAYLFEKGIKNGLVRLLEELERIRELKWVRLLYTYPTYITDELIDFISSSEKVVHYLDVPFQHASSKVLKDMGRNYDRAFIEKLVEKLKIKIPDIALRSTFIVGFPTETEEDFKELLDFLEYAHLDWSGFFPYYHEDGTKAYELFEDMDYQLKEERLIEAQNLATQITEEKNGEFLDKEVEVLVDEVDEDTGMFSGRSFRSAYEIDGVVLIDDAVKTGEFVKVKIVDLLSPVELVATKV